jgi:GT2 family glycosyltransferase
VPATVLSMSAPAAPLAWVVLTTGGRPVELDAAITSLRSDEPAVPIVVVGNGSDRVTVREPGVRLVESEINLGVPGGRDLGVRSSDEPLIGFLDDDAELRGRAAEIVDAFTADPRLGAVALRLVDEDGATARRHIPRAGRRAADVGGDVAYFLGGACAVRRRAYDDAGGYFTELFYGHEEIELSWRLLDAGWGIRYLSGVEVFHPRTDISRHADGWALTGRNRVWIARRTLPWPVALVHVLVWLVLGSVRSPGGTCRRSYVKGWWSGWRTPIDRRPISWRTVWRLTRLGRPPVI